MDFLSEASAPPRLHSAEGALAGEARASWIQRLCGNHQYSIPRLIQISGIQPTNGDWDRVINNPQWLALLDMAGCPIDTCDEAIFGMTALSRSYPARSFLLYESHMPCSRWCSKCLASDSVPYLRWEWRLAAVKTCSVHQIALTERCPWCSSHMRMHRALLVAYGATWGVPNLATCADCGMSLVEKMFSRQEEMFSKPRSNELMDELLTKLKRGHREPAYQFELNFNRYAAAVQVPESEQLPARPQTIRSKNEGAESDSARPKTIESQGSEATPEPYRLPDCMKPSFEKSQRDWFWSELIDLRPELDPMRVNRLARISRKVGDTQDGEIPKGAAALRAAIALTLKRIRSEMNVLRSEGAKFDSASRAAAILSDIAVDKEFLAMLARRREAT